MTSQIFHLEKNSENNALLFQSLLKNHPDGIIHLTRQSQHVFIKFINDSALDLIGLSSSSTLGKDISELPTSTTSEILQYLSDIVFQPVKTVTDYSLELAWPNGVISEVNYVPEFDEYGAISNVLAIIRDITEVKRTEISLEQEKIRLKTFFNALVDMVWIKDVSSKFLACNPAFERFFGISEAEVIGQTDRDITDPEAAAFFIQKDKEAIAAGKPTVNDEWVTSANGTRVLLETTKTPLFDTKGNIIGVLGFAHDITEKTEVKAQLLTMLDNHPDVLVRYDRNLRRIYVNQNYQKISQSSVKQAIGKILQDSPQHSKLSFDDYQMKLERVFDTGRPEHAEIELLKANGQSAIYGIRIIPEYDAAGKTVSLLTIGRDVSEFKKAERLLKTKEREYRTLVENSPDIIIRYDRECRRTFVNQAYINQTGIPSERVLNTSISDEAIWLATMTWQEYNQQLKQVMKTGNSTKITLDWINNHGLKFHHELFVVPEYGDNGEIMGVLAIGRDITTIKNYENSLAQSNIQLRGLAAQLVTIRDESRKNIAREMHDELGQYLTSLRLEIALLRIKADKVSPEIFKQAKELTMLVDKLIQVVRDIAVNLRPAPLDMGVISALEWLTDEFNKRTGIACNLIADEPDIISDDKFATTIFRIVQESLTNITKYANASQVEVALYRNENNYLLTIKDNGEGFDTSKVALGSYGLVGMRERAIMLDGELKLISNLGYGTTISVKIPVK